MMFGPNTLGTLVLLVATVLLFLVTASSPIENRIYFLAAKISASVTQKNVPGIIKLGVFGYCIEHPGETVCTDIEFGYRLDLNELLRLSLPDALKLSDSVVKGLTLILVVHPIAASFAVLSVVAGLVSHIAEFNRTCWISILSSCAAGLALIGLIFDFVIFGIIRKRINALQSDSIEAVFGPAMWMSLTAWLLLSFSGCFFCAGRCLLGNRRNRNSKHYSIQMDTKQQANASTPL